MSLAIGQKEPQEVERTKRTVIAKNDLQDYSSYSTEKLKKLQARFRNMGEVGRLQLVAFELQKRGVH